MVLSKILSFFIQKYLKKNMHLFVHTSLIVLNFQTYTTKNYPHNIPSVKINIAMNRDFNLQQVWIASKDLKTLKVHPQDRPWPVQQQKTTKIWETGSCHQLKVTKTGSYHQLKVMVHWPLVICLKPEPVQSWNLIKMNFLKDLQFCTVRNFPKFCPQKWILLGNPIVR